MENLKQKYDLEIWWRGSYPQSVALIQAAVSEKLKFTDDGRTPAPLQWLCWQSSRSKKTTLFSTLQWKWFPSRKDFTYRVELSCSGSINPWRPVRKPVGLLRPALLAITTPGSRSVTSIVILRLARWSKRTKNWSILRKFLVVSYWIKVKFLVSHSVPCGTSKLLNESKIPCGMLLNYGEIPCGNILN